MALPPQWNKLASVALHLQATLEAGMRPEDIELSRRYADILRVCGNAERTIDNYLYALKGFAQFLGERPRWGIPRNVVSGVTLVSPEGTSPQG